MRQDTILQAHARRSPEKTAVVIGGRRVTYGELYRQARALALGMRQHGAAPGQRVLVYLPNGIEFVQAVFAAFAVGAVVVPVNTRMTAQELAYFIDDSAPVLVLFHADQAPALAPLRQRHDDIGWVAVGGPVSGCLDWADLNRANDETLPEVPLDAEACRIMYTSGTTGRPKGALITHANLIVQHCFLNAIEWGLDRDDRFLVTTPLAHRTGLARMLNALLLGATLIVMDRFDPAGAIDAIERERVTALGMVPTICRMLMPLLEEQAERCASLRHLIVTGEAFPVDLKRRLIELLPAIRLHSFFAMTEVGSVTSLEHDEQFSHPGSVGRPTPGVEVKLVNAQGAQVSVGEVGEMLVRSGTPGRFTTMQGYFNRPQESAAALTDGWLHTGDMARFDTDGYLYIVDRKKDMVLSGGFNIYTKEVEQALVEHPAVADAAVIGIPDPIFGEAVVAFVETAPGLTVTETELIEHTRQRLAGYKKPKHLHFVDALPRTPLGKVLKPVLRERALAHTDQVRPA